MDNHNLSYHSSLQGYSVYRPSVSLENAGAVESASVPNFDGVVAESTHYLVIVVLQTVHTFALLTSTLNFFRLVFARLPIFFNILQKGTRNCEY